MNNYIIKLRLFDTITHVNPNNTSAIPTPIIEKRTLSEPVILEQSSIDNGAHGTEKLLLNTQVSKDFA